MKTTPHLSVEHHEPAGQDEPAAPVEPSDVHGARLLALPGASTSSGPVLWEYRPPLYRPYLPLLRTHTVSLCIPQDSCAAFKGDLMIVPAGQACRLLATNPVILWNLSFTPSLLQRARHSQGTRADKTQNLPQLRASASLDDVVLRALMLALRKSLLADQPVSRAFIDSLVNTLCLRLLEQYCHSKRNAPRNELSGEDMARLSAFLSSRLGGPCEAADAAAMLGLKPAQFTRLLKARTGQSFARYSLQQRLDRAFELLQTGRSSVTEAALETCFANLTHFSRVFRKHFGVPPSALKR